MKKFALILFFTLLTLLTQFTLHSQWVQQTVPVSKPITGIKFIDTLKGWACTDLGTGGANYCYVLHTTNSGTNWIVQDSTFGAHFEAICVIDSNIIYAGGFDGASTGNLNKTTNGGLTWTVIPTPTNMSIFDMQFLNKDSGWTCGSSIGADVRTTTDGGLSWTVRTNGISAQTQRIFFLNYSTGFCIANFFLYKTTNAGLNWVLNGNFSNNPKSVFFLNQNTGWVGATSSTIYFTSNAGTNWQPQVTPSFAGTITDVSFVNSQTGWGGVSYIVICKTTNGGANWGYQFDTSQSNRITILDSLHGWTGQFGISHTANGGAQIIYTGFINNNSAVPTRFVLYQNYPNPFNPTTNIKLDLPRASNISLVICDILGREIYNIANEHLQAGSYNFIWDARKFSSGIYFYRLTTDTYTETKKMILIK